MLPGLNEKSAYDLGLIGPPRGIKAFVPDKVEVLREGSMTTVPEDEADACTFGDCDNPRIDHPRAKYCEAHKDPKNRKE